MKILKQYLKKILRKAADFYETVANPRHQNNKQEASTGWSIVVITDGKSNHLLSKLIDSVKLELSGTPYEIILVGPSTIHTLDIDSEIPVKKIVYKEIKIPTVTGWITKKKNTGISAAKYDKVVVCHDYIALAPGWKSGYDSFGDFDVCSNIFLDIDGERSTDWITWDYPGVGQALVPYDKECTRYQYLSGIYFVGKRDFLIQNPQLENLRWGEAEDIEWSRLIGAKTKFRFNSKSTITFLKTKWKLSKDVQEGSLKLKSLL